MGVRRNRDRTEAAISRADSRSSAYVTSTANRD
jgi:hypothetical protein